MQQPQEGQDGIVDLSAEDNPRVVEALLTYLYYHDYCRPPKRMLLSHARIFAIGDLYQMPGLKGLAVQRFKEALSYNGWKSDKTFSATVETVYNLPSENDGARGMRDAVVETTWKHFDELKEKKEFKKVWRIEGFNMDVAVVLRAELTNATAAAASEAGSRRYDCGTCGRSSSLDLGSMIGSDKYELMACEKCDTLHSVSDWRDLAG